MPDRKCTQTDAESLLGVAAKRIAHEQIKKRARRLIIVPHAPGIEAGAKARWRARDRKPRPIVQPEQGEPFMVPHLAHARADRNVPRAALSDCLFTYPDGEPVPISPDALIANAKRIIAGEKARPRRWFGFGGETPLFTAKALLLYGRLLRRAHKRSLCCPQNDEDSTLLRSR